jgi:hypothetical protein
LFILVALVGCNREPSEECSEEPGTICAWAGTGTAALGKEDVEATKSHLYLPQDVTFADDGNGYLLDWNNHRIRKVDTDGMISTIAGSSMLGDGPEGPAMQALFNHPTNLAFDHDGNLIVSAWHNSRVEKIDLATGEMSYLAGTGARGYNKTNIDAKTAILDLPSSVQVDDVGNIWFSDQANQQIRMIDTDGIIHDVGGQQRVDGYLGDGGPVATAIFHASVGQAADPANRIALAGSLLYIADTSNHIVRVLDTDSMIVDCFAGTPPTCDETGTKCAADNFGATGDGGDALDATLYGPTDVAVGPDGEVYIADTSNSCVRVVDPDGVISTFAGTCGEPGYEGEGGAAQDALLQRPYGVSLDPDGNVYISDTYNNVIRKVFR